jgi:HAD superfamily hydrolase (TIGR01509 family)
VKYKCIIFDCDGVLVDSEKISSKIFMEMAAELGFIMDLEYAIEKFTGTSMKINLAFIEKNIQGNLPHNFEQEFRNRTFKTFKTELKPIPGIQDLVNQIKVPFCVASSGPIAKIELNLTTAKLIDNFRGHIFSSYDIGSWKPEPGIYLHAAKEMGFEPKDCAVIEDSEAGIKAAIAGGFNVFAIANKKGKDTFEKLGARVFFEMDELSGLLEIL